MARRQVTVELDDDTLRRLHAHGDPGRLLAQMATTAAGGFQERHARRTKTDESLSGERKDVDERLDEPGAPEAQEAERGAKNRRLATKRASTDEDLSGERGDSDRALVDMREANQHMVSTTIEAQEAADQAGVERSRAETRAIELHEVAELREMFIGILGHDLRSPLSAISIAAGRMLRRGRLAPEDQRLVGTILRSDERMARMIVQLLDLTRTRLGGGLPLAVVDADLRVICNDAAAELEVPPELELEGDLTGTWDPDRLSEALVNLLGNAAEYSTPGTSVRVAARSEGDEVVVEVSNQGPSIPPELLPILFEPFRRARQQEKSAKGNLGLGLYITKQIALAHGGTLEARSSGGRTTFAMRLPRRPPASVAAAPKAAGAP